MIYNLSVSRSISVSNWLSVLLVICALFGSYPKGKAQADLQDDTHTTELVSDPVLECADRLFNAAGKGGTHVGGLLALYRKASRDPENVEFMQYVLSVMYQESRFNRTALSSADAYGLMQMTVPAVEDAVRHCKLKPLSDMSKLHDSYTNVKYGTCYLKKLNDEMGGDWTRTLIAYNGGYVALAKYDKGDSINNETSNYVLLVNRALNNICRNSNYTEETKK